LDVDRLMAQANSQLWQPKHFLKSVTMIFIFPLSPKLGGPHNRLH
jgi:hypothetical protein